MSFHLPSHLYLLTAKRRPVRVQIPITVVHMVRYPSDIVATRLDADHLQNSLDIIPNDLRDVALAIYDRYPRNRAKVPIPGRAFVAPREHALSKALQDPLMPSQAPLQPRKATPQPQDLERRLSRSRSRGRTRDTTPPIRVDFDTGVFGQGALDGLPDPRTATPEVQKMIWDEQMGQVDLARRRSTVVSRGSRARSRSKSAGRGGRMDGHGSTEEFSNVELLKQLESLKEAVV